MYYILLEMTYHSEIVEVPKKVHDNLMHYQLEFDKWLGDRNNDHGYWISDPNRKNPTDKDGLSFGAEAFVKWLIELGCPEGKESIRFYKRYIDPTPEELAYPTIHF